MNKRRFAGYVLFALMFSAAGYCLRELRNGSPSILAAGRTAPLDYFLPPQSFSEVENAKGLVEALSSRYVTELRTRYISTSLTPAAEPARAAGIATAMQELERGIEEFQGTGQEFRLVEDLLMLVKRESAYDRWLDTYLGVLYRHPTQELIGRLAGDALVIGRAAGREPEVLAGFKHVRDIPLDFEAKHRVETAIQAAGDKGVNWSGTDGAAALLRRRGAEHSVGASTTPSPLKLANSLTRPAI